MLTKILYPKKNNFLNNVQFCIFPLFHKSLKIKFEKHFIFQNYDALKFLRTQFTTIFA